MSSVAAACKAHLHGVHQAIATRCGKGVHGRSHGVLQWSAIVQCWDPHISQSVHHNKEKSLPLALLRLCHLILVVLLSREAKIDEKDTILCITC